MEQPLISLIIPVYNVEAYLPRCLESVLAQTYARLQILLIDDGSPDNSPQICDDYAQKDARITVIHKANAGAGAARNTGLEHAQGDYVTFIDADDTIVPEFVACLYDLSVKHNAPIAVCSFRRDERYVPPPMRVTVFEREDALAELLSLKYTITVGLWNKLYRRSLFDQVRFPGGQAEDTLPSLAVFEKAERVCVCNAPMYFYFQRPGSTTQRGFSDKLRGYPDTLDAVVKIGARHEKSVRAAAELFVYYMYVWLLLQILHAGVWESEQATMQRIDSYLKTHKRYRCPFCYPTLKKGFGILLLSLLPRAAYRFFKRG